jgi:ribosomal protein L7/L12
MRRMVITGWNVGFQKIEFTKTVRKELSCSLTEAKGITESVLDRRPVEIEISEERFDPVSAILRELGAVVHEEEH